MCCANVDVMDTIANEVFQELRRRTQWACQVGEHQHITVPMGVEQTAPTSTDF